VTVDVTGTWYGRSAGGGGAVQREVFLELKQDGSKGSGSMRTAPWGAMGSGPIDGTVTGDVFRFKDSKGSVEGEMTVETRWTVKRRSTLVEDQSLSDASIHPLSRLRRPVEPVTRHPACPRPRSSDGVLPALAEGLGGPPVRAHLPVDA